MFDVIDGYELDRGCRAVVRIRGIGGSPEPWGGCGDAAVGAAKQFGCRGAAVTELDRDQAPQEADDGADPSVALAAQFARAADYDRAGDLAAAIGLYESVLTGREALCGADHPDTRAARRDLADAYERSGAVGGWGWNGLVRIDFYRYYYGRGYYASDTVVVPGWFPSNNHYPIYWNS